MGFQQQENDRDTASPSCRFSRIFFVGAACVIVLVCMVGVADALLRDSAPNGDDASREAADFVGLSDGVKDDATQNPPTYSGGSAANWAPDPANDAFHLMLDTTWSEDDPLNRTGGDPFPVPANDQGIEYVGVENGLARFRANLGCSGGDVCEVAYSLGNVPNVGIVDAGAPYDGTDSRESEWGQPRFPASTMVVYRRVDYRGKDPSNACFDILARVPDEARTGTVEEQALAAARQLEQAMLSIEGSFMQGGMRGYDYRIAVAEGFADAVRMQAQGLGHNVPSLFTLERLSYEEFQETVTYRTLEEMHQQEMQEWRAKRERVKAEQG